MVGAGDDDDDGMFGGSVSALCRPSPRLSGEEDAGEQGGTGSGGGSSWHRDVKSIQFCLGADQTIVAPAASLIFLARIDISPPGPLQVKKDNSLFTLHLLVYLVVHLLRFK